MKNKRHIIIGSIIFIIHTLYNFFPGNRYYFDHYYYIPIMRFLEKTAIIVFIFILLLKWTKLLLINNRIIYISFIIIILIAGAAATSFGTGFYADLKLEAETTETKSSEQTKTNLASVITAGNSITMLAGEDITQKGSITIVKTGDITYNAGQNIEISASKDTYNYKSDTETKKASITIGSSNPAALATDSIGGDIGYSEASKKTDAATHNNAGVTAAKGSINITTGADAKINGANLLAENIHLNIGNNLLVQSKQNQLNSYGDSNSFNLGYDTGAGAAIGGGYGKNNTNRLWTDTPTSIIGTNGVNINVNNNTDLIGALIANINNGIDTANLAIRTGGLTYANLQDYDNSQNSGFNLQLSDIKTEKNENNKNYLTGNAQIKIENQGYEKEQTTKATVGAGSIKTGDNSDTTDLNRNATQTQTTTKDTVTAALDLETGLDLRLMSEAGRDQIYGELKTAPNNIVDNTWILSGGTKDTILTIAGTFAEFFEASAVGAKIDGGIKEKVTAAKVNVKNQYNANIQQIKDSFALRADIAQQADFLNSLIFLEPVNNSV